MNPPHADSNSSGIERSSEVNEEVVKKGSAM